MSQKNNRKKVASKQASSKTPAVMPRAFAGMWLATLGLMLIFVSALWYLKQQGSNQTTINNEKTTTLTQAQAKPQPHKSPSGPQFDFYRILPNMAVQNDTTPATQQTQTAVSNQSTNIANENIAEATKPTQIRNLTRNNNTDANKTSTRSNTNNTANQNNKVTTNNNKVPVVTANAVAANPVKATGQAGNDAFFLQIAALKHDNDAARLKSELSSLGVNAEVMPMRRNGQNFYRVQVGPYHSRKDAILAKNRLAQNNFKSIMLQQ